MTRRVGTFEESYGMAHLRGDPVLAQMMNKEAATGCPTCGRRECEIHRTADRDSNYWAIHRIVDQFHVSTPDHEIEADLRRRNSKGKIPPEKMDEYVEAALERHRQNRQQYQDVMGGNIGSKTAANGGYCDHGHEAGDVRRLPTTDPDPDTGSTSAVFVCKPHYHEEMAFRRNHQREYPGAKWDFPNWEDLEPQDMESSRTAGVSIVCRHGRTIEQGCKQCLGDTDWHVENRKSLREIEPDQAERDSILRNEDDAYYKGRVGSEKLEGKCPKCGAGVVSDAPPGPGHKCPRCGWSGAEPNYEKVSARLASFQSCECDHPSHRRVASVKVAESHPPYYVRKRGDEWCVINDIGESRGCHPSKGEARQQQKALYVNVPGASEAAEEKHKGSFIVAAYGVFPHSIQRKPTGRGHVVREVTEDGRAMDGYNYGGVEPVKIYKTQRGAQQHADKLYAAGETGIPKTSAKAKTYTIRGRSGFQAIWDALDQAHGEGFNHPHAVDPGSGQGTRPLSGQEDSIHPTNSIGDWEVAVTDRENVKDCPACETGKGHHLGSRQADKVILLDRDARPFHAPSPTNPNGEMVVDRARGEELKAQGVVHELAPAEHFDAVFGPDRVMENARPGEGWPGVWRLQPKRSAWGDTDAGGSGSGTSWCNICREEHTPGKHNIDDLTENFREKTLNKMESSVAPGGGYLMEPDPGVHYVSVREAAGTIEEGSPGAEESSRYLEDSVVEEVDRQPADDDRDHDLVRLLGGSKEAANVHYKPIEDGNGDLVDEEWYHHECASKAGLGEDSGWPAPESRDYPVHCAGCGERIEEIPLTDEGHREYGAHDCGYLHVSAGHMAVMHGASLDRIQEEMGKDAHAVYKRHQETHDAGAFDAGPMRPFAHDHGRKSSAASRCDACGVPTSNLNEVAGDKVEHVCDDCASAVANLGRPNVEFTDDHRQRINNWGKWKSSAKTATNWLHDGTPIENGFDVMSADEAEEELPFFDRGQYLDAVDEQVESRRIAMLPPPPIVEDEIVIPTAFDVLDAETEQGIDPFSLGLL